jgi:hypothetical protein
MLRSFNLLQRNLRSRCFASAAAPPGTPSSKPPAGTPKPGGGGRNLFLALGLLGVGAGAYYYYGSDGGAAKQNEEIDYKEVAKDISALLEKDVEYDGLGHYGPILVSYLARINFCSRFVWLGIVLELTMLRLRQAAVTAVL